MTSVRRILIKGGRVIDPSQGIDKVEDVAIADAKILGVDSGIDLEHAEVIDATGMIVCPGFIDLHTHLREPGFEYKETIETGTAAAARGGFTTVCAMPNTSPVMDSRSIVDFVLTKAAEEGVVRVLPIGGGYEGQQREGTRRDGRACGGGRQSGSATTGIPCRTTMSCVRPSATPHLSVYRSSTTPRSSPSQAVAS